MAELAYNLEHFAPQTKRRTPEVRVAKRAISARKIQFLRMVRTLFGVTMLVLLVCSVLYTQATVTELQTQIADRKQELVEEEALYAYLSFELDNKTSVKSLEESAANMGLARMTGEQVIYFRVGETEGIHVRENPFSRILQDGKNSFLSIFS